VSHVDDVCEAIRVKFDDATVSFEVGENNLSRNGQRRRIIFVRADGLVRHSTAPVRNVPVTGTLKRQVFERFERIQVELRAESDTALDVVFDRFLDAAFLCFGPNILKDENPYDWAGGDSSAGGANTSRQPAIRFDLWIRLKAQDYFPQPTAELDQLTTTITELGSSVAFNTPQP
jgi:hypothetical protein